MERTLESTLVKVAHTLGVDDPLKEYQIVTAGHINDTYRVKFGDKLYTMQRVNRYVFKNPKAIMSNIDLVTHHLRKKIREDGGDPERETLRYLRDGEKRNYVLPDGEGGDFWRMSIYIDKCCTYNVVTDQKMLESAGHGFGTFQRRLTDFPAEDLFETIPNFHNTPVRLNDLFDAVAKDACGRVKECGKLISVFEEQRDTCGKIIKLQQEGKIPLRVTHNDTKFNNILIDDDTHEAVCVIDLDTVMPGISCYDFGDAIRFAGNTAAEDEIDLSRVTISMKNYESFTRGFMSAMDGMFTKEENENMAAAAIIDTLEIGGRFLEDYLRGDKYFKINYPTQNYNRAANQVKLALEMIKRYDEMDNIVRKYQ